MPCISRFGEVEQSVYTESSLRCGSRFAFNATNSKFQRISLRFHLNLCPFGHTVFVDSTHFECVRSIRFQIFNGEYNQIATWLRRGQIDCGFLALPCAKEFDTTFLLRDSLTVILPPNHPLRDAECFPVSRLSDEDFISLMEEQDYEINLFLEHLRQSPRIKFEVSSDFAILAMVECGLGISVVHDLILHPNRHGIIKKPLDEPYYRDIAIATSAAAQPSTITRMFCEHALEWARDTSSVIAPATAEAPEYAELAK